MKLLQKHELLPLEATKEQVAEFLSNSSFRSVKRTTALLSGDKERLLRKGRNVQEVMEYDLDKIIATYNFVALTINYNISKALEVFKQFIILWPTIKNVRSFDDVLGIFADAEESEDDEAELA